KAKVEKFRNLLFVKKEKENLVTGEKEEVIEPELMMVAYKEKQQEYLESSEEYLEAEISLLNAKSPADIIKWRHMERNRREALNSAHFDWVVGGYKNEVEVMASYIDQVTKTKHNSSANIHETPLDKPLQLTDEEKAKVEKFRNLLFVKKEKENLVTGEKEEVIEPGPLMVAYKEKQREYLERSEEYFEAEISLLNAKSPADSIKWSQMKKNRMQALNSARSNWVATGYKNEVEVMASYIDQVTKRNIETVNLNGEHITK
ncbi:hypothetical protein, partial [Paenibacillus sp. NPDC055715]